MRSLSSKIKPVDNNLDNIVVFPGSKTVHRENEPGRKRVVSSHSAVNEIFVFRMESNDLRALGIFEKDVLLVDINCSWETVKNHSLVAITLPNQKLVARVASREPDGQILLHDGLGVNGKRYRSERLTLEGVIYRVERDLEV